MQNEFQAECDFLQKYLNDNIPLTKAIQLNVVSYDGQTLSYTAPLSENHNDKNTGFAGSLFATGILTAWGFANLKAKENDIKAEIVASNASIAYKKPIKTDFRTECTVVEQDWQAYFAKLAKRKNATLTATVNIYDNVTEGPCAILTAEVFAYFKREESN